MLWLVIAQGFVILMLLTYLILIKKGHVHEWNKWEDDLLNIVSPSGKHLYKKAVQYRSCATCGMNQRRDI